ncbi:MAG: SRPBCC family protein [Acidimicrobiia bacterium]
MSVDAVIDGSAAAVWELVSDITLPTRFSSELAVVEWLGDDSSPRVGARFAGRSQHAAIGGWQTECVITAYQPPRCFEWSVGDPGHPSSIWRFTVTEAGVAPGSVRLEQWFQMGPARSGLNAAIDAMPEKEERIVARRLGEHRANMEANVAGIKALVECGAP